MSLCNIWGNLKDELNTSMMIPVILDSYPCNKKLIVHITHDPKWLINQLDKVGNPISLDRVVHVLHSGIYYERTIKVSH